jgi:phage/plasmid-associated DNA primase
MNFDADSGIKRRLIHFEFRNKFVSLQDLEKERINHKIGKVFALDSSLVSKFHTNDSYKNALIHILIKKAKQYFDSGLTIPEKYVEIAKEICEENDKFKNFFENHFEITNKDIGRIAKDELRDMYNSYTKCNFSASSIMTDIQRLQLKYERGLRCVYNGVSLRGVIVGIKKLKGQAEPNKQQANDSGLDYGIEFVPEPEVTSDPDPDYTEKLEKDFIAGKIDKVQFRKGMDKLVKERVKMMSNITMNPKMIEELKRQIKTMKQTTGKSKSKKGKSKQ